jgi:hypothetical protein
MTDDINSPRHYTQGHYESIEMIEDQGHGEGFCYGNALKYIHRARFKGDEVRDLRKACWYLERRIKQLDTRVTQKIDPWPGETQPPETFVKPAIGNRVAGDTPAGQDLKYRYYGWDGSSVLFYCDWCDIAIRSGDTHIEGADKVGELRFCCQAHHDEYFAPIQIGGTD